MPLSPSRLSVGGKEDWKCTCSCWWGFSKALRSFIGPAQKPKRFKMVAVEEMKCLPGRKSCLQRAKCIFHENVLNISKHLKVAMRDFSWHQRLDAAALKECRRGCFSDYMLSHALCLGLSLLLLRSPFFHSYVFSPLHVSPLVSASALDLSPGPVSSGWSISSEMLSLNKYIKYVFRNIMYIILKYISYFKLCERFPLALRCCVKLE